MAPTGMLEKLRISAYESKDFTGSATTIEVSINPEKYTHNFEICYTQPQTQGSSGGSPVFNRTPSEQVGFELVFDGTGVVPSARPGLAPDGITQDLDRFKKTVFAYDGQIHRPRYLQLSWGPLLFHCCLKSLTVTYTLFKPDGTPLRARADTAFIGYTSERELALLANNSSPDLSHLVTVKAGDNLPLLCHRIYGTSVHYLKVAAVNDLTDFMALEGGLLAAVSAARKARDVSDPSPRLAADAPLGFKIESSGGPFDSAWQVASIDVTYAVNRLPRAQLVISDGSPDSRTFPIAGSPTLLPGATLTISAGYGGRSDVIFEGLIVKQGIEIGTNSSQVVVELADAAIKMTLGRKSAVFKAIGDGDLISHLITTNGLVADVATTTSVHEEMVQFHATDWDLMVTRAEANGLLVGVFAGKVTVKPPDPTRTPALQVEYGDSVLELQAELDTTHQAVPAQLHSHAWDFTTQTVIDASPTDESLPDPGDVAAATLAGMYSGTNFPAQSGAPLAEADLAAWSAATMMRSRLAKIRGHVRYRGSALAGVGDTITLAGLGDHFNGALFVGGVHHEIRDNVWISTAMFGLSPQPFAATTPRIAQPDAAGLLPPIRGLQTGVVQQVATDPRGNFRVLVTLPLLQAREGVWARLAGFYASNGCGALFYPEIGDEVVIGFMADDPRYPVVLGSVYSAPRSPADAPDPKNTRKGIVTASDLRLSFDDERKVVSITTPAGHKVELNQQTEVITIADSNSNKITLGKDGITIVSATALKLVAKGDISLEAGANIKLRAPGHAAIEALDIDLTAEAKLAVQASGLAQLSSADLVVVSAPLIKLN